MMNTLSRAETSRLHGSGPGYEALVAHWRRLVTDKEARKALTAAHFLLYAVLRGKDWRKGFTRATRASKLANGHDPQHAANEALRRVHLWGDLLAAFGDSVTRPTLERVRAILPRQTVTPLDAPAYLDVDACAA